MHLWLLSISNVASQLRARWSLLLQVTSQHSRAAQLPLASQVALMSGTTRNCKLSASNVLTYHCPILYKLTRILSKYCLLTDSILRCSPTTCLTLIWVTAVQLVWRRVFHRRNSYCTNLPHLNMKSHTATCTLDTFSPSLPRHHPLGHFGTWQQVT